MGSIEEKTHKSYTCLEYEYTINKGIPIFLVVLTDDFLKEKATELGGEKVYEQSNIDKHENFRELVLSKIVRMVDDSKDIKLAIHTTLVDFLEGYDMVGWIRSNDVEANVTLLNQLNELTVENKKLNEVNLKLQKEINLIQTNFESDLAVEEEVTIQCTYTINSGNNCSGRRSETSEIEKVITWKKMF